MPLRRLTHFTPARNLPHIFRDRRLRGSAEMSQDVRSCFAQTDLARLDGHPDKVCCSFEYPNAFYLNRAKQKGDAVNYPDWVCLLIDKEAASATGTLFCPRNAAAGLGGQLMTGIAGLRACYADEVRGRELYVRGAKHDPKSPTDVQAEVLLPSPIELSVVHAIVFPTHDAAAQEHARAEVLGYALPGIPWRVSAELFRTADVTAAVKQSRYFNETAWTPGGAANADGRSTV
ncbi:DarT ssDNA thymidine ADP-ribosyltransferase family protein [Nocardia salmonicida]|uniref:DarT ssDNA thymidine ADP-ribosyltransferase family protein n=1 Tax=Nocardia salmonicida TaxID=53431 RepID=UPI0033DD06D6